MSEFDAVVFGNAAEAHEFVARIARKHPKAGVRYLEVGVREGDSLKAVLDSGNVIQAVGVDNWGTDAGGTGRGVPDVAWGNLTDAHKANTILLTGDSKVVLAGMRGQFDVIYIDGNHSEEGCLSDLDWALPLLAEGGSIVVDDLDHPAHRYLRDAVTRWAAALHLRCATVSTGYGMAVIQR